MGLRGRIYLEVFGVDDSRFDETMADVERRFCSAAGRRSGRLRCGPCPARALHGVEPASTRPISSLARERGLKVMSHVAESKDELTYIRSGSGKFAHDYREKMGWERMLAPALRSHADQVPAAVGRLRTATSSPCTASTLTRDDIRILRGKRRRRAHCPKSNAKLGCGIAPLADLLHEGVRVGLGTDSPASSNIMDMFDEMRTMLFLHRAVERDVSVLDAQSCVRIATLGGAEALGMEARRRQSRAGQERRPHRRRRLALALRADRRPVLGAGLRRQSGRHHTHRHRRDASCSATALTSAWTRTRSAPEPSAVREKLTIACARAPSRSAAPTRAGGRRRPLIEGRPSKCCSIAARSGSGRR